MTTNYEHNREKYLKRKETQAFKDANLNKWDRDKEGLTDRYIMKKLNIPWHLITDELIRLKREEILLKRQQQIFNRELAALNSAIKGD